LGKIIERIEFVSSYRDYTSEATGEPRGFDGSQVREYLDILTSKPNTREKFENEMGNYLTYILGEETKVTDIKINPEFKIGNFTIKDFTLIIAQKRGGNFICLNLTELGTGVVQIVLLLTLLYVRKLNNDFLFFLLEEPESNLHPEILYRFIEILKMKFGNYQFFISTHSSSFLDRIRIDWKIYSVSRRKDGSSKFNIAINKPQQVNLLENLGIRASNLLQSNIVLWVEGPSDIIYLKKWISDISNGYLQDKIHYSFSIYGGSTLGSISENDLISLTEMSRYSIVIGDSDKNAAHLPPKRLKPIYKLSKNDYIKNNEHIYIWITDGREIENYIPESIFKEVLNRQSVDNIKVEKLYPSKKCSGYRFYDSFDKYFARMFRFKYKSDRRGTYKIEDYYDRIADDFEKDKVNIAKKVVSKWEDSHYSPLLRHRMQGIINKIMQANGLFYP
jgi:hypothetical protein